MSNRHVETNFDAESGSFLLQLRKSDVGLKDEPLSFEGKRFEPKDEVHITIFGSALGAQLAELMQRDAELEGQLRAAIDDREWSYRLREEWYHVVREESDGKKGYAESIIQMADVPAIEGFYEGVRRLVEVEIEPRPTHVTLYIFGDSGGIGIANRREFEKRVRREISRDVLHSE